MQNQKCFNNFLLKRYNQKVLKTNKCVKTLVGMIKLLYLKTRYSWAINPILLIFNSNLLDFLTEVMKISKMLQRYFSSRLKIAPFLST